MGWPGGREISGQAAPLGLLLVHDYNRSVINQHTRCGIAPNFDYLTNTVWVYLQGHSL